MYSFISFISFFYHPRANEYGQSSQPYCEQATQLTTPSSGHNPFGIVTLSPDLTLDQAYDISVDLTLPRSPTNLGHGNFMVALYVLKSVPINPALELSLSEAVDPYMYVGADDVVYASRRPALIPYEDRVVSAASRVLFLLYHILFARASETLTLSIPMGERVQFRGMRPLSMLVDVQAGQTLQVYSSRVTLVARLTGIRWFMYNHRILAFAVCTASFWLAEVLAMGSAWLVLGWVLSKHGGVGTGDITKKENAETDTMSRQGDLARYEIGTTKKEDSDEDDDSVKEETPEPEPRLGLRFGMETPDRSPQHVGDADDEGDSDDGRGRDGASAATGLEHGRSGQVRRRVSRGATP